MAAGEAEPNLCPVGGAAVAAKLGEILGVSVGSIEPKRAVVKCRGHLQTSEYIMDYDGPKTCQAAKLLYDGRTSCNFACLGYGDCTRACEYDAIHIVDHIAKVNEDLCIGCSACAKVCPNSILEILPRSQKVYVTCMNHEKGADTRKVCSNGCIGCKNVSASANLAQSPLRTTVRISTRKNVPTAASAQRVVSSLYPPRKFIKE